MLKFYGYKKCGTSRKAEKALQEANIEYKFIDITEKPPARTTLAKIIKQSGEPIKKFFNTSGEAYKSQNMKEKIPTMTNAQITEALAANGRLIKRPIVTDGQQSTVGFSEETFKKTWK